MQRLIKTLFRVPSTLSPAGRTECSPSHVARTSTQETPRSTKGCLYTFVPSATSCLAAPVVIDIFVLERQIRLTNPAKLGNWESHEFAMGLFCTGGVSVTRFSVEPDPPFRVYQSMQSRSSV